MFQHVPTIQDDTSWWYYRSKKYVRATALMQSQCLLVYEIKEGSNKMEIYFMSVDLTRVPTHQKQAQFWLECWARGPIFVWSYLTRLWGGANCKAGAWIFFNFFFCHDVEEITVSVKRQTTIFNLAKSHTCTKSQEILNGCCLWICTVVLTIWFGQDCAKFTLHRFIWLLPSRLPLRYTITVSLEKNHIRSKRLYQLSISKH